MAANKFATMLHKNCHKVVVILAFAVLEWLLIILLLLNSLFSYLIQKFTEYFGLKPFCTFCSRLDHILDNRKHRNSHLDHICEAHMIEISRLSYCSNHRRLSESNNMCNNCSATCGLLTCISRGVSEKGEEDRCSCCNEILSGKLFKPTWDVLDYIQEKASFAEVIDAGQDSDTTTQSKSLSEAGRMKHERDQFEEKQDDHDDSDQVAFECEKLGAYNQSNDDPVWNLGCDVDNESAYITDMLLRNAEDIDSDRFICIELIDREPLVANGSEDVEDEEGEDEYDVREEDVKKCKKSSSNVAFSTPRMDKDSAEAEEVEGLDTFPDKQVEEKKCSLEKVGSRMEDSFDGSVISDKEESMTVEDLKSTIKAQQRALNALYVELEEERKAAAIAADETMAMITKLQEEKALVKIEALQYQRMMEEQAEYDQEALQLLNDLVIKREKEKQLLEKELELYQNKVLSHEIREKMEIVRSNDDRCIDLDDCDDGSSDSDQGRNFDDDFEDSGIRNISLAEFDEERLLILEELKAMEAKVFAIHDDETQICKDVRDFDVSRHEDKEAVDTSCNDPNAKNHFDRKTEDLKAKKLLPLFDATENEYTKEEINSTELDECKFFLQEEFGHVYERLQALEADKEFLKHCISSMTKGNKGLSLLQEILQHLRDLRSAELSARKLNEIPLEKVSLHKED